MLFGGLLDLPNISRPLKRYRHFSEREQQETPINGSTKGTEGFKDHWNRKGKRSSTTLIGGPTDIHCGCTLHNRRNRSEINGERFSLKRRAS